MSGKDDAEVLREQLEDEAKNLELELKSEIADFKKATKRTLRDALLVAGGILAAYGLLRVIIGDKKKVKTPIPDTTDHVYKSQFKSRIKTAVLTIALEFAKKKLVEFLNKNPNDPGKPEQK